MRQKTHTLIFLSLFIGTALLIISCGDGDNKNNDAPATTEPAPAPATVATPTSTGPVTDTIELVPDTPGTEKATYCNYEIDSRPVPPNNDGIIFGMFICINCTALNAPPCPDYKKITINKIVYDVKRHMQGGNDQGCIQCLINPGAKGDGKPKKFKIKK